MIGWHFKPQWQLKVGLERQQLTEVFSWNTLEEEAINVQSDTAFYHISATGQYQNIAGDRTATKTTLRSVTHYNRYTLYNAPIFLSYHQPVNKLNIVADAGVLFNFYHQFSGRYLNLNKEILTREEASKNYASSLGLAWQASIGIEYSISSRLNLLFHAQHRQYLSSFANESITDYSQRYHFTGFRVGASYLID